MNVYRHALTKTVLNSKEGAIVDMKVKTRVFSHVDINNVLSLQPVLPPLLPIH